MDTKKILMYGGGAIVLGAVTYFVWAFFQKPVIPIGNTTIALGDIKEDEEETKTITKQPTKKGSGKVYDFSPVEFEPIFTPNVYDVNSFALKK
jgi:hypothetical protein